MEPFLARRLRYRLARPRATPRRWASARCVRGSPSSMAVRISRSRSCWRSITRHREAEDRLENVQELNTDWAGASRHFPAGHAERLAPARATLDSGCSPTLLDYRGAVARRAVGQRARVHRAALGGEPPLQLWLGLLFLALASVTVAWVSIDRRPPEWDHANHLERALRCHLSLADGRLWAAISGESSFYPPLVPCAAGLLYFAFPVTPLTAQAVMLAFLALGLAAVYHVGRRRWDERPGLLAALLFGTAPFVIFSLLNFQLDLPLASMVALTLAVALATEGFRRPAWCAVLGVVLGLGMLTKPTYLVYVAGP